MIFLFLPVIAVSVLCTGCISFSSHAVGVEASAKLMLSEYYEVLGEAEGISSGFQLFWVIPVVPAATCDEAVDDAVKSKGGHNLIEAVFTRETKVYIVGTVTNIYVKGKVIRYKSKN
jgi:hypothetical protein